LVVVIDMFIDDDDGFQVFVMFKSAAIV